MKDNAKKQTSHQILKSMSFEVQIVCTVVYACVFFLMSWAFCCSGGGSYDKGRGYAENTVQKQCIESKRALLL